MSPVKRTNIVSNDPIVVENWSLAGSPDSSSNILFPYTYLAIRAYMKRKRTTRNPRFERAGREFTTVTSNFFTWGT